MLCSAANCTNTMVKTALCLSLPPSRGSHYIFLPSTKGFNIPGDSNLHQQTNTMQHWMMFILSDYVTKDSHNTKSLTLRQIYLIWRTKRVHQHQHFFWKTDKKSKPYFTDVMSAPEGTYITSYIPTTCQIYKEIGFSLVGMECGMNPGSFSLFFNISKDRLFI